MPDAIMYQPGEIFVVLETDRLEQFLSAAELLDKLKGILALRQHDLPPDLTSFESLDDQAQHLMETGCELDLGPDSYLQWYVTRLEK